MWEDGIRASDRTRPFCLMGDNVASQSREPQHLTPFQALSAFLGAAEAVEQTRYHILAKEKPDCCRADRS